MSRYMRIQNATLGELALPLPLSLGLGRRCEPLPAAGDSDAFVSSVQLGKAMITAELTMRGIAVAESLSLGQTGTLTVTIAPAVAGQPSRTITIQGAVLHAVELEYQQTTMACAVLRFVAVAPDGAIDPFGAEEA